MADLPEKLKKYLPAPLFILLYVVWWFAADPIKEFVQKEFKRNEALIRLEDKTADIHVVHLEVTTEATKDFEDVQVQFDLLERPARVAAQLFALDGTHPTLTVASTNPEATSYLINQRTLPDSPITLKHRESIEIFITEPVTHPVREVWLTSKERPTIRLSDFNQRWPLAEIGWRLVAGILGFVALFLLGKLLFELVSRKAREQLEEDIQFLHLCEAQDPHALATFQKQYQPLVDSSTQKYLKSFNDDIRRSFSVLIPEEIFRRAETLPKLRHSLKGEIQRFVILLCIQFFGRQLKAVKAIARVERKKIH